MNSKNTKMALKLGINPMADTNNIINLVIDDLNNYKRNNRVDLNELERILDYLILLYNIELENREKGEISNINKLQLEEVEELSASEESEKIPVDKVFDFNFETTPQKEKVELNQYKEVNISLDSFVKDFAKMFKPLISSIRKEGSAYKDITGSEIIEERCIINLYNQYNIPSILDIKVENGKLIIVIKTGYTLFESFEVEYEGIINFLKKTPKIDLFFEGRR